MNRLEVLLEALKEIDRHVEEMCKQHGHSYPASVEARQRAGEIKKAILSENTPAFDPPTPAILPPIVSEYQHEKENQRLSDELHAVSAERDSLARDCIEWVRTGKSKPNPALENVLAKLRSYVQYCNQREKQDIPILSVDDNGATT